MSRHYEETHYNHVPAHSSNYTTPTALCYTFSMNLFDQIQALDFPAPLPATLLEIEQHFDAPRVSDVAAATAQAVRESGVLGKMQPGASVAIGVGSRGIANLPSIVQTAVAQFQAAGLHPLLRPPWAATPAPRRKARPKCWPTWA
ncbi:MAG: hypothetical protein R3A44_14030 [Caldilineaceae bacterium]